jgi:hypothetical protein
MKSLTFPPQRAFLLQDVYERIRERMVALTWVKPG